MEATAVSAVGRNNPQGLGLYHDSHIAGIKRITDFVHAQGSNIGIQLSHAGPRGGRDAQDLPISTPWPTLLAPKECTGEDLQQIIRDYVSAAERARLAGLDFIQVQCCHGYLLSSFLSPLTNQRQDEYGGSFENKCRLIKQVLEAIRISWPSNLWLRISSTDNYFPDKTQEIGWSWEDTLQLCDDLQHLVDVFDVLYVQEALKIKQARPHLRIVSGGRVTELAQAQKLLEELDGVVVGRALWNNPLWLKNSG